MGLQAFKKRAPGGRTRTGGREGKCTGQRGRGNGGEGEKRRGEEGERGDSLRWFEIAYSTI